MQLAHLLHHVVYKISIMKKIINSLYSIAAISVILTAAACNPTKHAAVVAATSTTVTNAINNNKWKFTASQVMPQYGEARQANGTYDVRLSNDTLTVYLPYFGKADGGANVMSDKGPLDFTSTNFTIDKKQNKKGQWLITIAPKDNREVRALSFTFSTGGYAYLTATMSNRTGISFSGTIVQLP
jgi:hypothetical protein